MTLPAGPELDAKVAEALGVPKYTTKPPPRPYSTDIAAAWELVDHVLAKHPEWAFALSIGGGQVGALFYESAEGYIEHGGGSAAEPAEAICLAFLKAKGVKV